MLRGETTWPLDLHAPVVAAHPLNQGRRSWWLSLQGLDGARWLYDLTARAPMSAVPGWGGSARPGGVGASLNFAGSGNVSAVPPYLPSGFLPGTFAVWARPTLSSANARVLQCSYGGIFSQDLSGAYLQYAVYDKTLGYVVVDAISPYTLGSWYRLMGVVTGASTYFYLNGVLQGSGSYATGTGLQLSSNTLYIGTIDGTNNPWTGQIDDVSIWDRALSAGEAWEDYLLSRAGYPTALRRLAPWGQSSSSPPPLFVRHDFMSLYVGQ